MKGVAHGFFFFFSKIDLWSSFSGTEDGDERVEGGSVLGGSRARGK